jgi:hypothetical protein
MWEGKVAGGEDAYGNAALGVLEGFKEERMCY